MDVSMTRRGDVITVPASQEAAFVREGWTPTRQPKATPAAPQLKTNKNL